MPVVGKKIKTEIKSQHFNINICNVDFSGVLHGCLKRLILDPKIPFDRHLDEYFYLDIDYTGSSR